MKDVIDIALAFITLILVQVLIFNHIVIFNVAVPMVFIFFITHRRTDFNVNLLLVLSFLLGLCIDIFSDTLGENSMACTIIAMLRRPILYAYVPRDDKTTHIVPSARTLGVVAFSKYMLTITAVYCFIVFSLDYFSISDWRQILLCTVGSTIVTFPLLIGFDSLLSSRRGSRI